MPTRRQRFPSGHTQLPPAPRYSYACQTAGCDYAGETVTQTISPGIYPSCRACGKTLKFLRREPETKD
jgi:hypothetical protein